MKSSNNFIQDKKIIIERPHGIAGVDYNVACTHLPIIGLAYYPPLKESKSFTIPKTKEDRELVKQAKRLAN